MTDDAYALYVRSYGKGASGARVTDADYGRKRPWGTFRPYPLEAQIAISLGFQDAITDRPIRPRSELSLQVTALST